MRNNIYDVIKNAKIDIPREYARIYRLFFQDKSIQNSYYSKCYTCKEIVNLYFDALNKKLVGRCLDLDDFNGYYGYHFSLQPENVSVDDLIKIAEYVFNFVYALHNIFALIDNYQVFDSILAHIESCMADIGRIKLSKEGITIFTENSPAATSVAEIVDDKIAYSVLEYNHHRLKGDLDAKKKILYSFALDIEPCRKNLRNYNSQLETDMMQLIQKLIRHNNMKNEYIENMSRQELEDAYDDIYQMYLLAKMTLDHCDSRKKRVEDLIKRINE